VRAGSSSTKTKPWPGPSTARQASNDASEPEPTRAAKLAACAAGSALSTVSAVASINVLLIGPTSGRPGRYWISRPVSRAWCVRPPGRRRA
jgi:hypothetical protein